jgi:hypothetical protein
MLILSKVLRRIFFEQATIEKRQEEAEFDEGWLHYAQLSTKHYAGSFSLTSFKPYLTITYNVNFVDGTAGQEGVGGLFLVIQIN